MPTFRDVPVRQKLLVIVILTTVTALALSGLSIVVMDSMLFRSGMRRDLMTLARIVADNSTAAISFDDPRVAGDTLNALRARSHMVAACIYRPDGTMFAQYQRDAGAGCPLPLAEAEVRTEGSDLVVSRPIVLQHRTIGTLVLRYDLGEARDRMLLYAGAVLAILIASSLIALALSSRLRDLIVVPVSLLATAASSVSRTGDYGVRVQKNSRDELGVLVEAFNQMLARIQSRDIEVESARNLLETTLTSIGDAVISTDVDGRIVFANPVARTLLRLDTGDVAGKPIVEVFRVKAMDGGALAGPVESALHSASALGVSTQALLSPAEGTEIPIELSASAIRQHDRTLGVVLVFRNIGERLRYAEEMRQTQKLESLGVLAGGIAHDFNNLLTGILGNASLALDMLPEKSPGRVEIADAIQASERAAQLAQQMLAYSGKGHFVLESVDLSARVRDIVPLIKAAIPSTVEIELRLDPQLPAIEADSAQLQQLIMNIIINGAEAVPEGKAGTVTVTTARQQVDIPIPASESAGGMGDLQPGSYVVFAVADTGAGMDEQTRARIFDPFFTTKFTGRGLGLAAVLGIVRGHKGSIQVSSTPGKGTTFRVLFPAVAAARQQAVHAPAPAVDLHGSGTVLVVDDEAMVRNLATQALRRFGYEVVLAEDGARAVDVFQKEAARIGCVVLDLTMPVMSGEETLERLRSVCPDVPIILSSGFNEAQAISRFEGKALAGFLQKPYKAGELLSKVRTVMGKTAP